MSAMKQFTPEMLLKSVQTLDSILYDSSTKQNASITIPTDRRKFYIHKSLETLQKMNRDMRIRCSTSNKSAIENIQRELASIEENIIGDTPKLQMDPTLEDVIRYSDSIYDKMFASESWKFFNIF